ncbi:uncharacterized protein [Eurosta solidaginis]|uniref:uncharacterized protein n=1 Tax=Eurosta solidaginis TaxID=178769 RepID=UPI0035311ECF
MKYLNYLCNIFTYFFIFLHLNLKNVKCRSNFEIIYTKFNCTKIDPQSYLDFINCNISKNSQRSSLNIEMKFKKDLNRFRVNILIAVPRGSSDFVILNLKNVNGCQIIGNQNQGPFLTQVLNLVNQYGNIIRKCPYKRDTLYYLRAFRLDMSALPPLSFETDMKCIFELVREGHKIFWGCAETRIQMRHKH